MKELKIENLSKTYGTKNLLLAVNLSILTGDRIGLIGANGSGKSSFLKVIAGLDSYDEGSISKPNDYTIAYLDQNPEFNDEQTILETVYQSQAPQIRRLLNYEQARLALEAQPNDEELFQAFTRISDEMNAHHAWDAEVRAKSILSQLGLLDLQRKLGECSGGERKRIGLAQVLIADADLLILDEPTNHLSVDSIQWLEKYLANYRGALLLVTHDRYFLERSVNRIVELRQGRFYTYQGNYQDYLDKRELEFAMNERMQEKEDRLFQQELAWMRKGAKARTTKQQARIQRFENIQKNIEQRDGQVAGLTFEFEQQRIGQRIIDLEDVSIEIAGQKVISNYTKNFIKGERLGVIGRNGVGKSTFLNVIAGLYPASQGEVNLGSTVRLAYYRQLDQDLPAEMRMLAYLTQIADNFEYGGRQSLTAAQLLEEFNFPRDTHGIQIKSLSGGEKRRLYLLSLLIQEPNVILLDEPTNDLDIDTLNVLEAYLDNFEGVVIVVSHDRYFLDQTCDQLLEIQGDGQFSSYYGKYSDYLTTAQASSAQPNVETPKAEAAIKIDQAEQKTKEQRMTYHEKQEWKTLESDISQVETNIDEINARMLKEAHDAGLLMELQEDLEAAEAKLLELYERYDYLSELSL